MSEVSKIGCAESPCKSCPYRRDVPSGVWAEEEYRKLPAYDRPTWEQPPTLFMCHQQNNSLCTGWVQSHAARGHAFDLLALRFHWHKCVEGLARIATMTPLVKLFRTGEAAARHGMANIAKPDRKAKRLIDGITEKRRRLDRTSTEAGK